MKITVEIYRQLVKALEGLGFADDRTWSENVRAPETAEQLAREYTWVVLNSGMKNTVAQKIMDKVWPAITGGSSSRTVFRHPGKSAAIDAMWTEREKHLSEFRLAVDKVAWCLSLPWIGEITKWHLAKNLGLDVAKPDRWLERLSVADGRSVDTLCSDLSHATGDRIATVDLVLWRACAIGLLKP